MSPNCITPNCQNQKKPGKRFFVCFFLDEKFVPIQISREQEQRSLFLYSKFYAASGVQLNLRKREIKQTYLSTLFLLGGGAED